jgi:hypothetical protein
VAGPDLPDWPDPVNPDLKVGTVMGAISQTPNVLNRDDTGQDATFTFEMYAAPADGEIVRVYWGDVLANTYEVKGTEAEGDPIPVTIPWNVIEQVKNNPALPVHYRIGTAGSPNEQRSDITHVSVDAVVLTPEAPEYLHLVEAPGGVLALSCNSLRGEKHAVQVQVPDLSEWVAANGKVTLTWTPYDEKGEGELTDAIKTQEITLTPETVKGFIWEVEPYETHILPTYVSPTNRSGWATTTYAFTFEGHEVISKAAEAPVQMWGAGGSCPLD